MTDGRTPDLYTTLSARGVLLIERAAHTQRDTPGGSMRRGQHTFGPYSKEDQQSIVNHLRVNPLFTYFGHIKTNGQTEYS